eukprot:TRINITY_DN4503_c0_g2_i10.p1 TRINITY_DN4503_c0_g2~~TRINITY_DN4503_c0_g2_i10.p1  ORF type:complete len:103 (-),score=50.43 TRINITY_DN4503_c0_g2_i10:338-646(-)
MALPLLSGLVDKNGETLQQAALLAYLKQGEEAQPFLEAITAARLCNQVMKSVSKEDQLEAARMETTLEIAKWIKEHPYATQGQIREEVMRQIEIFKQKIQHI